MPRDVMTPSLDAARKVVEACVHVPKIWVRWTEPHGLPEWTHGACADCIAAHVRAVGEAKCSALTADLLTDDDHIACPHFRAALAEREREILAWKAGVLYHRCDQAVNEPGIFFHDRCLADYVEGVSFLEVAEKTDALSAGGERLRELLRHEIYRNHEHTDACDACKGSDAALALGAERGREEKG